MRPVGYVYVLSNPSMADGLVKVGMTDRHNVRERVIELSAHTGVPTEFVLEYVAQVFDAYKVEQAAHAILAERFSKTKEFFQSGVLNAVLAVRKAADVDLVDEKIHGEALRNLDSTELDQQAKNFVYSTRRGLALTGVTSKEVDSLPAELRKNAAWKVSSPQVPAVGVYYGEKFKTVVAVLKQANNDYSGWGQFDNAELLPTDAGERVRQYQAIQAECDKENAVFFKKNPSTEPQRLSRSITGVPAKGASYSYPARITGVPAKGASYSYPARFNFHEDGNGVVKQVSNGPAALSSSRLTETRVINTRGHLIDVRNRIRKAEDYAETSREVGEYSDDDV